MEMKNIKKNNKGFSLVELIVVIAIMAVLIAVLSPQLLRYVERTRLQRDNSAIAEVANAIKIAAANENINAEIAGTTGGVNITQDNTAHTYTFGTTALGTELTAAIGSDTVTLSSTTYGTAMPTIHVEADTTTGTVTVSATNYIAQQGAEAGPITF